jgi:hypothetical protein
MTPAEVEKLLDEGFMILEAFSSNSGTERNAYDTGNVSVHKPIIRAKYNTKRKWYVLEKGFKTAEARDKRLATLLALPKRVLMTYAAPPAQSAETQQAQAVTAAHKEGGIARLDDNNKSRLRIYQQNDGDMLLTVVDPEGHQLSVHFCTFQGGGRSPRVHKALLSLLAAVHLDNQNDPHGASY